MWKNLRNYSVRGIFYTRFLTFAPLSALLGEGLFLLFGVFAWSSAAVAAARWFCANTVWITLTARRMSAVMGYRCN